MLTFNGKYGLCLEISIVRKPTQPTQGEKMTENQDKTPLFTVHVKNGKTVIETKHLWIDPEKDYMSMSTFEKIMQKTNAYHKTQIDEKNATIKDFALTIDRLLKPNKTVYAMRTTHCCDNPNWRGVSVEKHKSYKDFLNSGNHGDGPDIVREITKKEYYDFQHQMKEYDDF